ncbi:hypothetical protein C7T94_08605 [Pedobacter yulinensis]|uniref:Alpha-L-rhamnosidase six-hairpin glycosidase domain-containing protein n=1 Tax=Pedobacter yulinensis TaxID=2126353 RepID=A0A2T3HJT0_9SPHI|nr:hypothetical protein [Pedobacter yulinensis]PST82706.1 hypothetical protein C7T94_08605 [Pedobacter yulinensis]
MNSGRRKFIRQSSLAGMALVGSKALKILPADTGYAFESAYLKLRAHENYPRLTYLATDSLGEGDFLTNSLLRLPEVKEPAFQTKVGGNQISYLGGNQPQPQWSISCHTKTIWITSNRSAGQDHQVSFSIVMAQKANHCTVLGSLDSQGQMALPCILHFPGMGSLKISCATPGVKIGYDALNDAGRAAANPYVSVTLPPANDDQTRVYKFESVAIYPAIGQLNAEPRLKGVKRDLLNIFQLNPRRNILANNSGSDNCVFTVYLYAEAARRCPDLFEGFPAMNLVRDTLNRYLDGYSGYGFSGHPGWISKYHSLDSYPSLIIAACHYISHTNDRNWGLKNYKAINAWADAMMQLDKNGDGLIEYGYSGNAGSWRGEFRRPANWWDAIGFGHDDAYSNALAYRALYLLSAVSHQLDDRPGAERYRKLAQKLKGAYYKAFFNQGTGLLAGWRSEDGKLHDYAFTFVNSIAVTYGLLSNKQSRGVMNALLAKMAQVGYTNFKLGLPGNLIAVRSEDYTHPDKRWGYGEKEDGSDGFQIYENGGASGCFAFYTLKALMKTGKKKEAEDMLLQMMDAFSNREFQGQCAGSKMSRDWKTWNGECWGYEGFLVDNYLTLYAAVDFYGGKNLD